MLRLDDGTEIEVTGRPAQGTRHMVLRGRDRRSGTEIEVKIERVPGCAGDRARRAGMGQCARRSGPVRAGKLNGRLR